jgi:hypothetical protein
MASATDSRSRLREKLMVWQNAALARTKQLADSVIDPPTWADIVSADLKMAHIAAALCAVYPNDPVGLHLDDEIKQVIIERSADSTADVVQLMVACRGFEKMPCPPDLAKRVAELFRAPQETYNICLAILDPWGRRQLFFQSDIDAADGR